MPFNLDAKVDPSQVDDPWRASGAGGPVIVGGGAVGLIILIAAVLLGVDCTGLIDTTSPSPIETPNRCRSVAPASTRNTRPDRRVVGFVDGMQKYWSDEFNRRGGSACSPARR